ncbi:hypothetical protein E2C01_064158 [Portunus trituberculatus]|uniref:Uncharacterized protein n=1 Tax=Portunus trituberculatus TaxID=210409 RepID=A0A5B7HK23_PORTR|nr:hypothetical protein [Portunus trituberculatus]
MDLGVTVDRNSKLKFHYRISCTAAKCRGTASNLLKSTVTRSAYTMSTLFIFDARPILNFASSVWNLGFQGQNKAPGICSTQVDKTDYRTV